MRGGFTFCGTDIADLGIEYAPDNANTYVFKEAQYKVDEESFDSHNGGYHYGQTMQPKMFTLRCFFAENSDLCINKTNNDSHINHGQMARIISFFKRGRTGRLVFDDRPWLYYNATVVASDYSNLLNAWNGLFTITMKAYYPFARTDSFYIDETNELMKKNTALIEEEQMPATTIADLFHPLQDGTNFILYNGGSERADVAIEIAGNVNDGVKIINHTTGQECSFVGINKNDTTVKNKFVVCDALNGKTTITDGTTSEYAYIYHDYGFIQLTPGFPAKNYTVSVEEGENTITFEGLIFSEEILHKYVYFDGWYKIMEPTSSDNVFTLNSTVVSTFHGEKQLCTMNEIEVVPNSTINLDRLIFKYKHTFE